MYKIGLYPPALCRDRPATCHNRRCPPAPYPDAPSKSGLYVLFLPVIPLPKTKKKLDASALRNHVDAVPQSAT